MLEEFISVALEAFVNANGDVDKFELQLRRKLMTYNNMTPQMTNTPVVSPQLDSVLSSLNANDAIFNELENVDINTMSDDEILKLAQKMGLMTTPEETNE